MPRALPIAAVVVLVLLALLLGAKHYLLDSAPIPDTARFEIDIDKIRNLARGTLKPLPVALNSAIVAERSVPAFAVVAGDGFGRRRMIRSAFQLVYPDGATILIDAAYDRAAHEENAAGDPFHDDRYEELQAALRAAQAIFVTHEHPDHIGGIARSPHIEQILPRVRMLREQIDDPARLARAGFPEEAASRLEPLDFETLLRPAPGIALIKAPGHTPGSQLIYVVLHGGLEFLFVGDIAWHMDNVIQGTGRPRLVGDYLIGEDRAAVLDQLRALQDLAAAEPALHFVVAHDAEQLGQHIASGRIGSHLAF